MSQHIIPKLEHQSLEQARREADMSAIITMETLAHKNKRIIRYRMTVKRAQEVGHWIYCSAQTLVGAKREATKVWRDSFMGNLFVEDMATGETWTRPNRGGKWQEVV